MAPKRLASEAESDTQSKDKRMRPNPSFASVICEAMMVRSFQSLCTSLEPLLRRVVNEEVERGLQRTMRTISRSPSLRIQAPEPASLRLIFTNKKLPAIFTCNKILDIDGEPLQLMLVEKIGDQITPKMLPYPIKVEIVAIDGDFPASSDRDVWTTGEFNRSFIKERAGRRPLLTKEVNYTLRNTSNVTLGELEFTDNSSWIRSRRFKLGARVADTSKNNVRILEALTDSFVVKDQRGELYKKHYPPMLADEVWRLEKIGKDGKFHKRLGHVGVHTVQDFLKLSVIDSVQLKRTLGGRSGISEKMWETILKHAKTCNLGNKLYVHRGHDYTITLDAACQIFCINLDGQQFNAQDLSTSVKDKVELLVKSAYQIWSSLEEVDRPINTNNLEQPQGSMIMDCSNNNKSEIPYEILFGGIIAVDSSQFSHNDVNLEFEEWEASPHIFN